MTIYNAKGKKDRQGMFPQNLKQLLKKYLKGYRPKKYLFESPDGGSYSASSLRKVLDKAAKRSGISKKIAMYTLRHSFATHIEDGTDLRFIQKLLGHTSIKTTTIYTHVAKTHLIQLKSPINTFDLN